jgi:hypothetical protein
MSDSKRCRECGMHRPRSKFPRHGSVCASCWRPVLRWLIALYEHYGNRKAVAQACGFTASELTQYHKYHTYPAARTRARIEREVQLVRATRARTARRS